MNPVRRRRLIIVLVVLLVVASVSGLVLYALRQNINLFYTPGQLVKATVKPDQIIRIGGMVVKNSVVHEQDKLGVRFKMTDYEATIEVTYADILPDLFREGQGIVVIGQLVDATHFKAQEVLAKHDEKYMPPGIIPQKSGNNQSVNNRSSKNLLGDDQL